VDEETVPQEGTFEYKMDEGVKGVPDEEDAGFCGTTSGSGSVAWESA